MVSPAMVFGQSSGGFLLGQAKYALRPQNLPRAARSPYYQELGKTLGRQKAVETTKVGESFKIPWKQAGSEFGRFALRAAGVAAGAAGALYLTTYPFFDKGNVSLDVTAAERESLYERMARQFAGYMGWGPRYYDQSHEIVAEDQARRDIDLERKLLPEAMDLREERLRRQADIDHRIEMYEEQLSQGLPLYNPNQVTTKATTRMPLQPTFM